MLNDRWGYLPIVPFEEQSKGAPAARRRRKGRPGSAGRRRCQATDRRADSSGTLDPSHGDNAWNYGPRGGSTMSVLVMGATGNVGGAIVEALNDQGVPVRAVSRSEREWPEGVEGFVGDPGDRYWNRTQYAHPDLPACAMEPGYGGRGMTASASSTTAVHVEGVTKRFGDTLALSAVDLDVPEGIVLGLLGPNGAGKTTLVRVLTTLLTPDAGRAELFGLDVARDAPMVRELIGLTGQFAAVDEILTGRENLEMFGRLFDLSPSQTRQRAGELLERFELADAADRPAHTYSGGMRRRLDLASSLLTQPRILFLDEPTTGLDPRSRDQIWTIVRELVRDGTTILLTTQYLEEADELADRIAVIDHGRLIAQGTGASLKERVGGLILEVDLADAGRRKEAQEVLASVGCGEPEPDREGEPARDAGPRRRVGVSGASGRCAERCGHSGRGSGASRPDARRRLPAAHRRAAKRGRRPAATVRSLHS